MTDQDRAFAKLERLKVGALFMEMGTGKTKVALDLIASKKPRISYVLWICPFSVKPEIEAERRKWHPEIVMEVVGCESIGSSDRIYLDLLGKVQTNRAFLVVDESLKIKNIGAKRTARIIKLGETAAYKLILNGTPISRNCLDLWSQMEFLSPKILGMTYNDFKNTYCEYYIRGRLRGLVKRQCNIPHLISKVEPYVFDSRLEIDARKHFYDHYYRIDYKEEYEDAKRDLLRADGLDFMKLAQTLQRMYCESPSKAKLIEDIVEASGEQFVVFVKFLSSIPNGYESMTGDTPQDEREGVVERFRRGDTRVLFITYGCGSYGLNLQFCHNIVFADHTFDYAQQIQAEARIYRIGQTSDAHYYNLWCRCGLEDMIRHSLEKKSNLLTEVKKEISEIGEDGWKERYMTTL